MACRPIRAGRAVTAATVVLTLVGLGTLAGCDDGPPRATVGNQAAATASDGPSTRYPTYVALGDSYTAAPGVPSTEQDDGCLRSNGNYPSLVNGLLGGVTFVDVSCSGASTTSLIGVQRNQQHAYAPQFDALKPTTSLVTIGLGLNDLDFFQTVMAGCIQLAASDHRGHPCRDYARTAGKHGGDLLEQDVRQIGSRMQAALEGIKDRSPKATVVMVGYPQPVPAHGTCRSLLPLAAGDYPYVRGLFALLDKDLAGAARKAGVDYTSMLAPSAGHDICAGDDAWVNGIGDDVDRALGFHPFAEEQQAAADLIVKAIGPA